MREHPSDKHREISRLDETRERRQPRKPAFILETRPCTRDTRFCEINSETQRSKESAIVTSRRWRRLRFRVFFLISSKLPYPPLNNAIKETTEQQRRTEYVNTSVGLSAIFARGHHPRATMVSLNVDFRDGTVSSDRCRPHDCRTDDSGVSARRQTTDNYATTVAGCCSCAEISWPYSVSHSPGRRVSPTFTQRDERVSVTGLFSLRGKRVAASAKRHYARFVFGASSSMHSGSETNFVNS